MGSLVKLLIMAVVLAGIALTVWRIVSLSSGPSGVSVSVPQFSGLAIAGENAFARNCAACHGKNAAGTDTGPPLVHNVYNSGHHPDLAFQIAVERGTRQHHWTFGNMPPQDHVGDADSRAIIAYVREMQHANGIP